jgi:hypothetical protein
MTRANKATLRTGVEVPITVLVTTTMALEVLMEKDAVTLVELVAKCKNADYNMFGQTQQKAEGLGLLKSGGVMDRTVESIIKASVKGEGMDISLIDPVQKQDTTSSVKVTGPGF